MKSLTAVIFKNTKHIVADYKEFMTKKVLLLLVIYVIGGWSASCEHVKLPAGDNVSHSIDDSSTLFQVMAWCMLSGNKPLTLINWANRDFKCGWPFRTASEIGRSPHLVAVTWKYKSLSKVQSSDVYTYITIRLNCGLTAATGKKIHQWTSCGTCMIIWPLGNGLNSPGWWLKCPCLIAI